MVKIQFDLTDKESKKLGDLKYFFKINSKTDVIKHLIKIFKKNENKHI